MNNWKSNTNKDIGESAGNQRLRIITMNMDDFRSTEKKKETTDRLEQGKVDIACVQETHDTNATDVRIGNYTIYSSPESKTKQEKEPENAKGTGGIAITIRTDLTANIKEITKCNERLMYIRIQTEKTLTTSSS